MSKLPGPSARAVRAVLPEHGATITRAALVAAVAEANPDMARTKIVAAIHNMRWHRDAAPSARNKPVLISLSPDLFEVYDPDAARWSPDGEDSP